MTLADGRVLYEDGKYLTLEKDSILADAQAAVAKLYG